MNKDDAKRHALELMSESEVIGVNTAIHTAAVACGAVGAVPIPIADTIPITAAQVTMIVAIGQVFDVSIGETMAKTILAQSIGMVAGRAASKTLLSFIPVAGWIANAAIAAGVTEALGWMVAAEFARGKYK